MGKRAAGFLILVAVSVSAIFVWVSSFRDLSALENTLLQIFSLGCGLIGSYALGSDTSTQKSKEMMTPHARSAFRRLISLYLGLIRVLDATNSNKGGKTSEEYILSGMDRIEGMLTEQIAQAADALEDWNDIVPDAVKELKERLAKNMRLEVESDE